MLSSEAPSAKPAFHRFDIAHEAKGAVGAKFNSGGRPGDGIHASPARAGRMREIGEVDIEQIEAQGARPSRRKVPRRPLPGQSDPHGAAPECAGIGGRRLVAYEADSHQSHRRRARLLPIHNGGAPDRRSRPARSRQKKKQKPEARQGGQNQMPIVATAPVCGRRRRCKTAFRRREQFMCRASIRRSHGRWGDWYEGSRYRDQHTARVKSHFTLSPE